MEGNRKVCPFFMQGKCKYGNQCKRLHPQQNDKIEIPKGNCQQSGLICTFFQEGKCKKKKCQMFHGYGDELQHINTISKDNFNIINMVQTTDDKFITTSEQNIRIWNIQQSLNCHLVKEIFSPGKILKMICSNGKMIFVCSYNAKLQIEVSIESKNFSCTCSLENINDIIEVENYVLCAGKGKIEVFQIVNDELIQKSKEIVLENNEEITCITLLGNFFFCGYQSGNLSIYIPEENEFLQSILNKKIEDERINKIIVKTVDDNSHYLITCAKNVKVFNLENNFTQVISLPLDQSALNILNTKNYEEYDRFILSLNDGSLLVLDENFTRKFEIKSKNNIKGIRMILYQINPNKQENEGDYIVVTDGEEFSIYMWIKEGSFNVKKQNQNNKNNNNFGREGENQRGKGQIKIKKTIKNNKI